MLFRSRPAEALVAIPDPGRHYSVPVGGIISFRWAASFRYGGRHHLVMMGGLNRNQHPMRRRQIIALAARSIGAFVSAAVMSGRFGKSPDAMKKEPVSKSTTTSVSKSSTIITLSASTPTPSDTLTGPGTLTSYQSFWPYGKDEKGNHTVPGPWFVSCASHVPLKGNDYVKVTVDPASFPSKTTLSTEAVR